MKPEIQTALTGAKAMKEGDGWADLLTFLHIFHEDGKNALVVIPEGGTGPVLWEVIGQSICTARVAEGPVSSVIFITDARMRKLEAGEERPENDNLQAKWQAGDRDGITECLIVHIMHADGTMESATQPYDAESQTWEEPTINDGSDPELQVGGGIVDALRLAVADIAPDGTKDEALAEFLADAHRNPVLQGMARMNRGEQIDLDALVNEATQADLSDLEATAARLMAGQDVQPPDDTSGVSIDEYLEED